VSLFHRLTFAKPDIFDNTVQFRPDFHAAGAFQRADPAHRFAKS
jgi:hypothetical protein